MLTGNQGGGSIMVWGYISLDSTKVKMYIK